MKYFSIKIQLKCVNIVVKLLLVLEKFQRQVIIII